MDKLSMIREMADRYRLSLQQVAYIGDDVNDLEALSAVGFSAAPADAMPRVKASVHYVCEKKGGEGAVREIADMILEAQKLDVRSSTSEVRSSRYEVRSSRKR
jgi:YrbI family 3-deoxy-D-manno-octulosonate 8-phosphate phosphatase